MGRDSLWAPECHPSFRHFPRPGPVVRGRFPKREEVSCDCFGLALPFVAQLWLKTQEARAIDGGDSVLPSDVPRKKTNKTPIPGRLEPSSTGCESVLGVCLSLL